MKLSIDTIVRGFARFLNASWNEALATAGTLKRVQPAEFMSDWAQANWELLVETPFRESLGFGSAYLEPYGEGADCNDASSRVWRPGALPTFRVVCRPKEGVPMLDLLTGRTVDMAEAIVFDHFAIKSGQGWHEQATPFDCVLGYQGGQEVLVRMDTVWFVTERVSESA